MYFQQMPTNRFIRGFLLESHQLTSFTVWSTLQCLDVFLPDRCGTWLYSMPITVFCPHMCVCCQLCEYTCIRGWHYVPSLPQSPFTWFSWGKVSHWAWNTSIWLGWLTVKPQEYISLHISIPGVTVWCFCSQSFGSKLDWLGILTQVLTPVPQVLYLLSHLPSPELALLWEVL